MGTKNNPGWRDGCAKAHPDEPMFTLLARDETAPALVRSWANFRAMDILKAGFAIGENPFEAAAEVEAALSIADEMEQWRLGNHPPAGQGELLVPPASGTLLYALHCLSKHAAATYKASKPDSLDAEWIALSSARLTDAQVVAAITLMAREVHRRNAAAGWWSDMATGEPLDRDMIELSMLVVTEIAEAMEGFRKNAKDDHLPDRSSIAVELGDAAIRLFDMIGGFGWTPLSSRFQAPWSAEENTVPRQLMALNASVTRMTIFKKDESGAHSNATRALAMIFAIGHQHGLDVPGAIIDKLEYNANRLDHKREARMAADGKKT